MSLLTASQLGLWYGELEVFSDITLEVADRARVGIVGPNGGGKTSLLRVLVGDLEPNGGTVARAEGLRIGYVPQDPPLNTDGTLRDEVMSAFSELISLEDALAASGLEIQRSEPGQRRQAERRYSALLQQYEAQGGYDYENRMERAVSGVGLPVESLGAPAHVASGGERTRTALARALLVDPDLLVLDEPTNHLDFKGLAWLESFLKRTSHAFVVVSHDRYFLDRVVDQVWELDRGRLQSFPGNYSKYRALKADRAVRQRREFDRQQEYIAKEEGFIRRYGAGQRAREARGRATRLARLERVEAPGRDESIHIGGVPAGRTGQTVLSTHDLGVGYGDGGRRVQLLSVPDLKLQRGSRTAIVGPNGVGKTTLLDTLLGLVPPVSGSVSLGNSVEVGYHRQQGEDLPENSTLLDALLDARNVKISDARDYLARFLFRGDDFFQPVSSLSGGERTRLALARLLVTEPNTLVLDEPTTHLDIPARESLEEALQAYDGTLLFVSHDRHLISLLAERLWLVEGGSLTTFEGTFEEWARQTEEVSGPTTRPARSGRPAVVRRASRAGATKKPSQPPGPNPEQVISDLESRVAEIEGELEAASERQDVTEIARLGAEYDRVQARLSKAVDEWAG